MHSKLHILDFRNTLYAWLRRTDVREDDLLIVARALLPQEIDEGTQLRYRMLQYEII